jgi:dTDP-4-amino-4,6-dideoxygalactose transaminase
MRDTPLVFGSPAIDEAEIAEVVATLRSGWIGMGPRVARFGSI